MNSEFFIRNEKKILIGIVIFLVSLTLLTKFYGATDIADYSDSAKYFSGILKSDIRSSHSYLYGFVHAPFILLFNSFFAFKITSLLVLFLIIYSLYVLNDKNKNTLWLALLSPLVWYMAPWISPIQIASLFFLWAYYFIKKYDYGNKVRDLILAGIFIGLSWAFWDTMLFFGGFMAIVFMYDKKLIHSAYLFLSLLIGLLPRLLLDSYLFGFPFYTLVKSSFGTIANIFGGIYSNVMFEKATQYSSGFISVIPVIIAIPLFFWLIYKPSFFKQEKKSVVFLTLSIMLILINPQIRYVMIVFPIIILLLGNLLNEKQVKMQLIISAVIALIFIAPYIIQIGYSIGDNPIGPDLATILTGSANSEISRSFASSLIESDLNRIALDYPDENFVVGNMPDTFQLMAHLYWGDRVVEFVSIQDYQMWESNESVLFERTFIPTPKIADRRQIWISAGMSKNLNDVTNYSSIEYGLSVNEPLNLENFEFVREYETLYLSKKIV